MFSVFRAKLAAGVALVFAAMSIYIKLLLKSNKDKAKKIEAFKQNAEIEAKRNKDDIKRAKFESTQQTRARQVSDNSAISEIDKNRGKIDDKDGFTTITR